MREIKFRAWEKPMSKEWCESRGIGFNPGFKGQMITMPIDNYFGLQRFFGFLDEEHHIAMQSTGLKDKNGVEMYSKDFFKSLINGKIWQIYYCDKDLCYKIKGLKIHNHQDETYSIWEYNRFSKFKDGSKPIDHIEVIGNIYQHPELMEEK